MKPVTRQKQLSEKSTPEKIPKLSTSTSSVANRTDSSAKAGSSLALSGVATYSSSESMKIEQQAIQIRCTS